MELFHRTMKFFFLKIKLDTSYLDPNLHAGVPHSRKRLPIPPVTFFFSNLGANNSPEIPWLIQIHAVYTSALPYVLIESKHAAGIP